jgi:Tol biopolymer transport system component
MQDIIWSPDERHNAFLVKKICVVDAFVIDPDGTNLHHIDTNLFGSISWSPDSQFVIYSAGQIGEGQTFVANADGTRKYALVNSNPLDQSPSWSPHIR